MACWDIYEKAERKNLGSDGGCPHRAAAELNHAFKESDSIWVSAGKRTSMASQGSPEKHQQPRDDHKAN